MHEFPVVGGFNFIDYGHALLYQLFHEGFQIFDPVVDHEVLCRGLEILGLFGKRAPEGISILGRIRALLIGEHGAEGFHVEAEMGLVPFPRLFRVLTFEEDAADADYAFHVYFFGLCESNIGQSGRGLPIGFRGFSFEDQRGQKGDADADGQDLGIGEEDHHDGAFVEVPHFIYTCYLFIEGRAREAAVAGFLDEDGGIFFHEVGDKTVKVDAPGDDIDSGADEGDAQADAEGLAEADEAFVVFVAIVPDAGIDKRKGDDLGGVTPDRVAGVDQRDEDDEEAEDEAGEEAEGEYGFFHGLLFCSSKMGGGDGIWVILSGDFGFLAGFHAFG